MTFLRPCYLGADRNAMKTRETERRAVLRAEGRRPTRQRDPQKRQNKRDASIIHENQRWRAQTRGSRFRGRLGRAFWIQPAGGGGANPELSCRENTHTSSAENRGQETGDWYREGGL